MTQAQQRPLQTPATPASPAPAGAGSRVAVRIDLHDGEWGVMLPGATRPVTCETLDEARRVAYLCAAHAHACELIVNDAPHERHEFLDGRA